ncbi:hypothetical protein HK101_005956, partial [Irineochytrium annulatum]
MNDSEALAAMKEDAKELLDDLGRALMKARRAAGMNENAWTVVADLGTLIQTSVGAFTRRWPAVASGNFPAPTTAVTPTEDTVEVSSDDEEEVVGHYSDDDVGPYEGSSKGRGNVEGSVRKRKVDEQESKVKEVVKGKVDERERKVGDIEGTRKRKVDEIERK